MSEVFIDGDFASGKGDCKYHCSPSCHPCQVGPEWVYGCTHSAWPHNRNGDFVPIVDCGGDTKKCDLRKQKFVKHYLRGLRVRKSNAERKALAITAQINEMNTLMGEITA